MSEYVSPDLACMPDNPRAKHFFSAVRRDIFVVIKFKKSLAPSGAAYSDINHTVAYGNENLNFGLVVCFGVDQFGR